MNKQWSWIVWHVQGIQSYSLEASSGFDFDAAELAVSNVATDHCKLQQVRSWVSSFLSGFGVGA